MTVLKRSMNSNTRRPCDDQGRSHFKDYRVQSSIGNLREAGGRRRSTESRMPAADQTYDNATVGVAALRQLHKRARRGRPPARCGLSRYLPAILLFVRSLFFLSQHLSRQCLGVNILGRVRVRVNTHEQTSVRPIATEAKL